MKNETTTLTLITVNITGMFLKLHTIQKSLATKIFISRLLFLISIFCLTSTFESQLFAQKILVAGTDFDPSLGKEGEYYIATDNIKQTGVLPATINSLYPINKDLLDAFRSKEQYVIIKNPVMIDSSIYKDLGADYMYVASPPGSGNSKIMNFTASDMVPGSIADLTVTACFVIDPVKTPNNDPVLNCVGKPTGVKIISQANSFDKNIQLDASKQGTCTTLVFKDAEGAKVDASGNVNLDFTALQSNECSVIGISKIELRGEVKPEPVSVQGAEVCAGEQILLKPKVPYNGTYAWEANDGGGWQQIGTTQSVAYETKAEKKYQFRFTFKPNGGTPILTSKEIEVIAVKCCDGPGGSASSRVAIYYDDFGVANPGGLSYKVWDYETDPTNPKQITKNTPYPYRWTLDQPPVGAVFNNGTISGPNPPLCTSNANDCQAPHDGEYVVAARLTYEKMYQGRVGSNMVWANGVTCTTGDNAQIAYDHS